MDQISTEESYRLLQLYVGQWVIGTEAASNDENKNRVSTMENVAETRFFEPIQFRLECDYGL